MLDRLVMPLVQGSLFAGLAEAEAGGHGTQRICPSILVRRSCMEISNPASKARKKQPHARSVKQAMARECEIKAIVSSDCALHTVSHGRSLQNDSTTCCCKNESKSVSCGRHSSTATAFSRGGSRPTCGATRACRRCCASSRCPRARAREHGCTS